MMSVVILVSVDSCVSEGKALTHVVEKALGPKPSMIKCATACDTWGRHGDESEHDFARCTSWSFSPRDKVCYLNFRVITGKLYEGSNGCGGISMFSLIHKSGAQQPVIQLQAQKFSKSCPVL